MTYQFYNGDAKHCQNNAILTIKMYSSIRAKCQSTIDYCIFIHSCVANEVPGKFKIIKAITSPKIKFKTFRF